MKASDTGSGSDILLQERIRIQALSEVELLPVLWNLNDFIGDPDPTFKPILDPALYPDPDTDSFIRFSKK
jgi:hypothetical protein